jgi:hypothetical protein
MPPSTHLFERPMDMPIPASNRSLALPIKNRRPRLLPGPVISVLFLALLRAIPNAGPVIPMGALMVPRPALRRAN